MRKTMIVALTILAALGMTMAQTNAPAKDDRQVIVPEGTRILIRMIDRWTPESKPLGTDLPRILRQICKLEMWWSRAGEQQFTAVSLRPHPPAECRAVQS